MRDLVDDLVSQGVEQTVSKTIRQTVEAVGQICSLKGESGRRVGGEQWAATVKEVAKKLGIDRSAASRRVKDAVKRGYLTNLETKRGQPHRLVIGDLLPDQQTVLPEPEEVKDQWRKMR